MAAMKACKELVESFKPIRRLIEKASEEAEKEGKEQHQVTWPAVCAAAEQANLPMSAPDIMEENRRINCICCYESDAVRWNSMC